MQPSNLQEYLSTFVGNDISQLIIEYRLPKPNILYMTSSCKNDNYLDDIRYRAYVATIAMIKNYIPGLHSLFHLEYFQRTRFVISGGAMQYDKTCQGYIDLKENDIDMLDYFVEYSKMISFDARNYILN